MNAMIFSKKHRSDMASLFFRPLPVPIWVLSGMVTSYISLKYLDPYLPPFAAIAVGGFLISGYMSLFHQERLRKLMWLYTGVIVLTLGLYEIYLWDSVQDSPKPFRKDHVVRSRLTGDIEKRAYIISHQWLGYAPRKDIQVSSSKFYGNELLYKVTYSIDSNAIRINPGEVRGTQCLVFFGGSFTFGEGVNDNETVAYLVGAKSRGRFHTYNFGFHGYGPHQMLAAVEQGFVENIVETTPRLIIYQALFDHVRRSAGLAKWDQDGPYYAFEQDGSVRLAGSFGQNDFVPREVRRQMGKSLIYRRLFETGAVDEQDIRRFLGIVDGARKKLGAVYPYSKFCVIVWDTLEGEKDNRILNGLEALGMDVYRISQIIPDYHLDLKKYQVCPPLDIHPTVQANEMVAEYILDEIDNKPHFGFNTPTAALK